MGRIGDGPKVPPQPPSAEEAPAAAPSNPAATASEPAPVDRFVRDGVGAQLQSQVQAAVAQKATAAKIQFSSEDVAYLATTFAAILNHNPDADRLKRSRLFAAAILKRKRLKKLFGGIPAAQMEEMCDAIGDVLDGSPVFGQLVDDVTQELSKLDH